MLEKVRGILMTCTLAIMVLFGTTQVLAGGGEPESLFTKNVKIYVAGQEITQEGVENGVTSENGGKVYVDGQNLIFDNYQFSGEAFQYVDGTDLYRAGVVVLGDINIQLKGENSIHVTYNGDDTDPAVVGMLVLAGSDSKAGYGKLDITNLHGAEVEKLSVTVESDVAAGAYGIKSNDDIYITSCSVNVDATNANGKIESIGIYSYNNILVGLKAYLSVASGGVSSTGTDNSTAIYAHNNMEIDGLFTKVEATSGIANITRGIEVGSGGALSIKDSYVKAVANSDDNSLEAYGAYIPDLKIAKDTDETGLDVYFEGDTAPMSCMPTDSGALGYYLSFRDKLGEPKYLGRFIYDSSNPLKGLFDNALNGAQVFKANTTDESDLRNLLIKISPGVVYTGSQVLPEPFYIYDGEYALTEGKEFTISVWNNVDVGTATIRFTGVGNYSNYVEKNFEIISEKKIPTVTLDKSSFVYNGQVQKPVVTSESDGGIWIEEAIDVGTYHVNVVESAFYKEVTLTFTIEQATPTISLDKDSFAYNGQVQKPVITTDSDGVAVIPESKNVGTYTVTIPETTNYKGVSATYQITKLSPTIQLSADKFVYNGSVQVPKITTDSDGIAVFEQSRNAGTYQVKLPETSNCKAASATYTIEKQEANLKINQAEFVCDGEVQRPVVTTDSDAAVKIPRSILPGEYKVTVPETENCKGAVATYRIKVQPTTIKKLDKKSKGFSVKVKKNNSSVCSGYQIRYSTKSNMSKSKKVVISKKAKNVTGKISKLKSKKKYYVQARSYIKISGKTYYSDWSKTKSVKTK